MTDNEEALDSVDVDLEVYASVNRQTATKDFLRDFIEAGGNSEMTISAMVALLAEWGS